MNSLKSKQRSRDVSKKSDATKLVIDFDQELLAKQ